LLDNDPNGANFAAKKTYTFCSHLPQEQARRCAATHVSRANSFKATVVDSLLYKYQGMVMERAPRFGSPDHFFCCPTPCSQVSILSRLTASLVSLFSPDALLPGPSAPTPCAAGTPCCLAAVRERTKHRHQVAGVLPSSGTCHCVEKPTNR
jgi:hypothetical protein